MFYVWYHRHHEHHHHNHHHGQVFNHEIHISDEICTFSNWFLRKVVRIIDIVYEFSIMENDATQYKEQKQMTVYTIRSYLNNKGQKFLKHVLFHFM